MTVLGGRGCQEVALSSRWSFIRVAFPKTLFDLESGWGWDQMSLARLPTRLYFGIQPGWLLGRGWPALLSAGLNFDFFVFLNKQRSSAVEWGHVKYFLSKTNPALFREGWRPEKSCQRLSKQKIEKNWENSKNRKTKKFEEFKSGGKRGCGFYNLKGDLWCSKTLLTVIFASFLTFIQNTDIANSTLILDFWGELCLDESIIHWMSLISSI